MTDKVKLLAIIERGKGKGNFSCFATESVDGCGINGFGRDSRETIKDMQVAVQEYKEMKAEEGKEFPDVEFDIRFDVGAFFDYYPIDVTAFAKYIGMNPSVLRQYVTALRQPKQEAIDRIRAGIKKLSEDLGMNLMVERPPVSYVKWIVFNSKKSSVPLLAKVGGVFHLSAILFGSLNKRRKELMHDVTIWSDNGSCSGGRFYWEDGLKSSFRA